MYFIVLLLLLGFALAWRFVLGVTHFLHLVNLSIPVTIGEMRLDVLSLPMAKLSPRTSLWDHVEAWGTTTASHLAMSLSHKETTWAYARRTDLRVGTGGKDTGYLT